MVQYICCAGFFGSVFGGTDLVWYNWYGVALVRMVWFGLVWYKRYGRALQNGLVW